MGWFDILIVTLLLTALVGTLLFFQMRSFGYAFAFGLLFLAAALFIMQGPMGDQIRKEMQEKAAASQAKKPA